MKEEVINLYHRGKELYDRGDFDGALDRFERLFEISDGFADARNMAGLIYHERGEHEKAIRCFETALKLNPNYTEVALNLTVICTEMGMYDRARRAYASARKTVPAAGKTLDPFVKGKLANMHADLAGIYHGLGIFEAAIDEYGKALNLRPDFADLRTKLGMVYRDCGEMEKAVAELLEARRLNPSYSPAGINLGIAYYSQGRTDEAKEVWKSVLEKDRNNRLALMYLRLTEKTG